MEQHYDHNGYQQQGSSKRVCPFAEGSQGREVRHKSTHLDNTTMLEDMTPDNRATIERAASLLGVPIAQLLTSSPSAMATSIDNSMSFLQDEDEYFQVPEDVARWHTSASDFGHDYDEALEFAGPWVGEGSQFDLSPPLLTPDSSLERTCVSQTSLLSAPLGPVLDSCVAPIQLVRDDQVAHSQSSSATGGHTLDTDLVGIRTDSSTDMLSSRNSTPDTPVLARSLLERRDSMHSPSLLLESEWAVVDSPSADKRVSADTEDADLQIVHWEPGRSKPELQRRRGPFADQRLRKETGNTRKLKACVRCRMQKIRCNTNNNNPNGICRTCEAVSNQSSHKIYTLPCLRYRMTECTMYRTGKAPGLEFTFRWPTMKLKDISQWASSEVRTIKVKSDVSTVPLELSVRKFIPIPQDSLHRAWHDGKTTKFKETTPYAIVNMASAVEDMRRYITDHMFDSVDVCTKDSDPLIRMTYEFAKKHMKRVQSEDEKRLMGNFFRFWFAVRRSATTEHITGEETLDMSPELVDKSFPLFGKIPLPPVMIQQLDMVLTLGILIPLQKQVLEDLQRIMLTNKPKAWLTVYVTVFICLHGCTLTTSENYRNARKHGLKRRYSLPTFISERHHSANVFLAHYHYCTQPCSPFEIDWRKRQQTPFADLEPDDILFLRKTKKMIEEKANAIDEIRELGLYEHEMFFVSQMFERDWSPRDTDIDYTDGTINDAPLKKYVQASEGIGEC
ncbi:hypothetical protein F5Y10DRAFT_255370 [Nemania abortiva]|nr:hypothetical protein F5Y10DRAFT_255370 [Nemania abortiva]